jgi:hypothetical protein
MDDYELLEYLEITGTGTTTVAPTVINLVALLLCRADAAGPATKGRTAALRLALVVLEHEELALV